MMDVVRRGQRLRAGFVVALVTALLVVPQLGQRLMSTSHEARFALLARDILERHAWFGPEIRGELYRNKPPLYPWSIAALGRLQGRVTEATAHAPVAIGAVFAALFAFLLGDRLFGPRVGLWAGLILATSYSFFSHSQHYLPDTLVVAFGVMAAYALWRAMAKPDARSPLVTFYAALALGVFAKGPVGLLPLLVAALWLGAESGLTGLRRLWSPAGVGCFILLTLSWLGPFLLLGVRSLVREVAAPGLGAYLGGPAPARLAGQAARALLGFLPWTFVAPLALARAWRARHDRAVRFALFWFVVPLVAILVSHEQRTRYLLPIYPGAALVVAWWADAHASRPTVLARVLAGSVVVGAVAASTAPLWLASSARAFVPAYGWTSLPLLLGAAILAAALSRGLATGRPTLLIRGTVAAMIVILGYGTWLYNGWVATTQDFRTLARHVEQYATGTTPGVLVSAGALLQLDFYLGRSATPIGAGDGLVDYVSRPEHPVAVVEGRVWKQLPQQAGPKLRVLDSVPVAGEEMLIVALR